MTTYDIPALLYLFDEFVEGRSWVAGRMSSFLGEDVLLDVFAHFLAAQGEVRLVEGEVPHRDGRAFGEGTPVPAVRDLDAWLVHGGRLVACECKQWTASSTDTRRSVPEEPAALAEFALEQWQELSDPRVWTQEWNGTTKVALPLRPPAGWSQQECDQARRVLIVWRPVSKDGTSPLSDQPTATLREGQWVDLAVQVFSASLYLRQLLAAGTKTLPAQFGRIDALLDAVSAIVLREP